MTDDPRAERCCWDASASGCPFHGPTPPAEPADDGTPCSTLCGVNAPCETPGHCAHRPLPTEAGDVERPDDGLRRYERKDSNGETYYDGIAAEADLKALHAEVVENRNADVDDILGIDVANPMDLLAHVLQSDWLAAEVERVKAEARRAALLSAADDPSLRLSGHSGISIKRLRARAEGSS